MALIYSKSLEAAIDAESTKGYKGSKVSTFSDGKLISEVDNRDLIKEKKIKIEQLRKQMDDEFSYLAPQHDQLNAALGVLTAAESDAIKDEVARLRAKYRAVKMAIVEAETFQELEQANFQSEVPRGE